MEYDSGISRTDTNQCWSPQPVSLLVTIYDGVEFGYYHCFLREIWLFIPLTFSSSWPIDVEVVKYSYITIESKTKVYKEEKYDKKSEPSSDMCLIMDDGAIPGINLFRIYFLIFRGV